MLGGGGKVAPGSIPKETKFQGRKLRRGKGIGKENMGHGKETGR